MSVDYATRDVATDAELYSLADQVLVRASRLPTYLVAGPASGGYQDVYQATIDYTHIDPGTP